MKIGRVPQRQTGRRQLSHPSRVTCRASVSNSCPSSLRVADPRWPLHSSTHPATRTDHDFRISPSVAAFVGASSSTVAASGGWCAATSSMLRRDDHHRCAAGHRREDLQLSRWCLGSATCWSSPHAGCSAALEAILSGAVCAIAGSHLPRLKAGCCVLGEICTCICLDSSESAGERSAVVAQIAV